MMTQILDKGGSAMSKQETERFFTDLDENEELRDRYWDSVERATAEATVELANAAGYDFTAGDLRNELDSQTAMLSEDELDSVAGGAEPLLSGSDRPGPRARVMLPFFRFTKTEI
jgi:predicted ribosomally synthesized peptide with nif11-like leader